MLVLHARTGYPGMDKCGWRNWWTSCERFLDPGKADGTVTSSATNESLASIADMVRWKRPKRFFVQAPTTGAGSRKECGRKAYNRKGCDALAHIKKKCRGATDGKLTSIAHWLDQEGGHHQGTGTFTPHT